MALAVRVARAPPAEDVIAFCGYHGWHDWYLAANLGKSRPGRSSLPGLDPAGVPRGLSGTALPFRYNQREELQRIVANHGSSWRRSSWNRSAIKTPTPGFWKVVRTAAHRAGPLLIIDEISAGFD